MATGSISTISKNPTLLSWLLHTAYIYCDYCCHRDMSIETCCLSQLSDGYSNDATFTPCPRLKTSCYSRSSILILTATAPIHAATATCLEGSGYTYIAIQSHIKGLSDRVVRVCLKLRWSQVGFPFRVSTWAGLSAVAILNHFPQKETTEQWLKN